MGSDAEVIDQRTIQHSGAGLAQLADVLEQLSNDNPSSVAIGIEVPRGAIVEYLSTRLRLASSGLIKTPLAR
jgi:hypothetical protein